MNRSTRHLRERDRIRSRLRVPQARAIARVAELDVVIVRDLREAHGVDLISGVEGRIGRANPATVTSVRPRCERVTPPQTVERSRLSISRSVSTSSPIMCFIDWSRPATTVAIRASIDASAYTQ